ncbi:MAG: EF-hand domain-containing protein [Rhodospirillales bacterium]|nr:EF-hand domain-containing protein [Rhodospirillales bacterium]
MQRVLHAGGRPMMMPDPAFHGLGRTKTMNLRTLLGALPLLLLLHLGGAGGAPPDSARTADDAFGLLDVDGNGQIDRAEWQSRKMAVFTLRDRDEDLQLRRGELPGVPQPAFAAADLNNDGAISGYEFNQAPFSQFDKADADDDVGVSAKEFRAYIETGAPR